MTPKNSLRWTLFWTFSAIGFAIGIYYLIGKSEAVQFLNIFMIEKLLSFDNLFVFLLIFNYLEVPDRQRRKVLNYGIIGAIVFRAICITIGVNLAKFAFIQCVLGFLLIYMGWDMAFSNKDDDDISESKIIKFAQSLSFPLFLIWIIAIELSDIVFAMDSIPVSVSISQDFWIVWTANIFAILGLRSFYFFIQSIYGILPQLKYGIALILAFIGCKMFLPIFNLSIDPTISLLIIIGILFVNISIVLWRYNHAKEIFIQGMKK